MSESGQKEAGLKEAEYERELEELRVRVKECEQKRLDVEARLTAENQSLKQQLDKVTSQLEKMQFEASMKQEKSRQKVVWNTKLQKLESKVFYCWRTQSSRGT